MNINKMLTKYNFKAGNISRLKDGYIVIHYVGGLGSAKSNCSYYQKAGLNVSFHYCVNHDGEIWQLVEDKNVAYHCGAASYRHPKCRNANSIGIEMCCKTNGNVKNADKDWYFTKKTVEATIELTKALMKKYNIPADHVVRHYDVTGKTCPAPYVFNTHPNTWAMFKAAIEGKKDSETIIQEATKNPSSKSFKFQVTINEGLNIRKGPGTSHAATGNVAKKGTYTIVEEQTGWGLLKTYEKKRDGWISLSNSYGKRV